MVHENAFSPPSEDVREMRNLDGHNNNSPTVCEKAKALVAGNAEDRTSSVTHSCLYGFVRESDVRLDIERIPHARRRPFIAAFGHTMRKGCSRTWNMHRTMSPARTLINGNVDAIVYTVEFLNV